MEFSLDFSTGFSARLGFSACISSFISCSTVSLPLFIIDRIFNLSIPSPSKIISSTLYRRLYPSYCSCIYWCLLPFKSSTIRAVFVISRICERYVSISLTTVCPITITSTSGCCSTAIISEIPLLQSSNEKTIFWPCISLYSASWICWPPNALMILIILASPL